MRLRLALLTLIAVSSLHAAEIGDQEMTGGRLGLGLAHAGRQQEIADERFQIGSLKSHDGGVD